MIIGEELPHHRDDLVNEKTAEHSCQQTSNDDPKWVLAKGEAGASLGGARWLAVLPNAADAQFEDGVAVLCVVERNGRRRRDDRSAQNVARLKIGGEPAVPFVIHPDVDQLAGRLIGQLVKVRIYRWSSVAVADGFSRNTLEDLAGVVGSYGEAEFPERIVERYIEGAFNGGDFEGIIDLIENGSVQVGVGRAIVEDGLGFDGVDLE